MMVASVAACLLVAAEPAKENKAPSARIVVTAEAACLHCTFGEGESCAVCLKIDDKTPILLEGKPAEDLFKIRLRKQVHVVEGTLKLKDKKMILVAEKSRPYDEKEKDKAPAKGLAYLQGPAICGRCDLSLCDECTLAVKNGDTPIILQGELAADHAPGKGTLLVTGKLYVDDRGLLRILAKKVDTKKE
jgi:hypothetical protein